MPENNNASEFFGRVGLVEPVIASGKSLGIKLLSVYDFLRCEVMYRNLVNKLTEQNMDENLCKSVCEQACLVSMCLYDSKNERVFNDGLSALFGLTPEELQRIYGEYVKLNKKIIKFDKIAYDVLENVKTGEHKNSDLHTNFQNIEEII